MKFSKIVFFALGVLLSAALVGSAQTKKKTSSDYWWEAEKTRNEVKEMRKTNPEAAAKLLENELEKVVGANVAADFFTTLGEIYIVDLKKPDEALKLYDRVLPMFQKPENKVQVFHEATMIINKSRSLIALKKLDDAIKLLNDNARLISDSVNDGNVYGKYAARLLLQAQFDIVAAQDKPEEKDSAEIAVLTQFLLENPRFLTLIGKAGDWDDGGYAMRELLDRLKIAKRYNEALGWGKLIYRLSAFDKKEIEKATRFLNSLWAEQENFPTIAQFNKAQTDAGVPNPLAKVQTPEVPEALRENFQKKITDLEGHQVVNFEPAKAREIINLRLLLGSSQDLGEAMNQAYQLLKKRPDLQDGSLQICRIFKAADGNLIRANSFLSYLEGNGENPVPSFIQEMQKKSSGNA